MCFLFYLFGLTQKPLDVLVGTQDHVPLRPVRICLKSGQLCQFVTRGNQLAKI